MTDKHSFFLKLIRGIEGEAQRSEAAANIACDRVNSISKSLRASEQRHEKVLNSLKTAEAKAAELFLQQSKTRKKLFSLYSSLQSVLAKSSENASALSSKKSTDPEVGIYPVGMTPLLWWRISVLNSFNVGSLSDFTRHAILRKEAELLSRDGTDSSHCDNIMPICQYFLLGTCLDEKCPYSHPLTHLGGTDLQSTKKSQDSHFAWILEKHRQYLSKFSEQSHRNSSSSKSNAQNHYVDQNTLTADSAHNGGDKNSTEVCPVREDSSKKKDSSGRYFNESHSNNLRDEATDNSEQRGWVERFIEQCKAALVKHRGSYEEGQEWMSVNYDQLSPSPDLQPSSTEAVTAEQKLLSCFTFNLLYGLSYKDQKQRDLCIRSCLQLLKPFLDDSPSSGSPSLVEAWKLFLILSLESNFITQNFCLLYWRRLVLHLEELYQQTPSLQPLLAAVCSRIADAAEDSTIKTLSSISTGVGVSVGTGASASTCKRNSVQFSSLRILGALWELERMCDEGRTEVALEALCTHLLLPSPFRLSQQSSLDLQCLPLDIAFATFFVLLLTGHFVGRKLFYSENALLVMSDEINAIAGSRASNLFRRCPFLRDLARDAFTSCFKSIDAFSRFGSAIIDVQGGCTEDSSHLPELSTVTANSGKSEALTAPLSAVHQSILWSYLLLLRCCTEEDRVPLGPYQLEEVYRFCDPFSYPCVYEGAAALISASDSSTSAHRSDLHSASEGSTKVHSSSSSSSSTSTPTQSSASPTPLSSARYTRLIAALDSYLRSIESCTASLETELGTVTTLEGTIVADLPHLDVRKLLDDLSNCPLVSARDVVSLLVQWVVSFSRSALTFTSSHTSRFTVDFVALCSRFLNEPKRSLTAAVFLNVLYTQVLMVVKTACRFNRDHSTSVRLIELVLTVCESTLRIEQSISIKEKAGVRNIDGDDLNTNSTGKEKEKEKESSELQRKRKRGGLTLPTLGPTGASAGDSMEWGGVSSLDCCISELDCVGPTSQSRLLERTLDLLNSYGMMNFNIVELLFQRALPSRGSADLLVRWILNWFRDSTPHQDHQDDPDIPLDRDQGRGVVSSDIIPPKTSLKNSILIATAFQNSNCASSLSFLKRLSPRSLFQLSFHFLRAENFTLFSTVQSLLGETSSFAVLLRSFCETEMLSRQIMQYKSKNNDKNRGKEKDRDVSQGVMQDCRWTLSENLDLLSPESDSMLQRLQEGLNEYQLNRKQTLDLSRLVPQRVSVSVSNGSFPFQSLALFSERLLVLDISSNFLTTFPPALLFFFQLQKLNLSHNQIKSLPQSLGTHLSNLQNLDLGDNKFCVFPACVLDMKSLEELRLGMNSLEYLPLQVKSLTKLQHLDISNNKFKVLSSDLTHIRFLKT